MHRSQCDRNCAFGFNPRIGWDCIDMCNKVLQHFVLMVDPDLSNSFAVCYVQATWRTAKVLALHKSGKTSYTTLHNYQPISLLSNMSMILETIINRCLMRQVESRCLLSPEQFGFQVGREVRGAFTSLLEDVMAAFCRCLQV